MTNNWKYKHNNKQMKGINENKEHTTNNWKIIIAVRTFLLNKQEYD